MAQLISAAAGNSSYNIYDTKIPELLQSADIVEAFRLYHYGKENFTSGSEQPAVNSIYWHLKTLAESIDNFKKTVDVAYKTSSHILELTDAGKIVEIDSSSDLTVTIPSDSTTNFDIKSTLDIIRIGTGNVTIVPESPVTIQSSNGALKLNKQFSAVSIYKRAANTWIAIGDLTT